MAADSHKEKGNQLYVEKQYEQAAACYGKAIIANPHHPTYYTNRALCYLKLQEWQLTVEDCQQALRIEPNLIKGHFFMGQALTEIGSYDDAIGALVKAHELARQQRKNFGEVISSAVRHAKKMRWKQVEEKRLRHQNKLHVLLLHLLMENKEKKLSKAAADSAIPVEEIHQEYEEQVAELNSLFDEVDVTRQKREVPDYLCGKISFDLMRDPCITPSGITFDRKDIKDHLQKVGHFDPVTRQPLTEEQLVPNLALKEAVDAFTSQNGWVENY